MSSSQPPTQPPPEDPHEGSEDDPPRALDPRGGAPAVPPRRYQPAADAGGAIEPRRSDPTVMDRLAAASGPLAIIAFFLIGFGTGMWYIAWVVFLVPAALHAWNRPWSSGS